MTYDTATDTWNLYLDGNLDASCPLAALHAASRQHPARRAGHGHQLDRRTAGFFNGVLDEVRIWNVARSQAQIQATMDQELTGHRPHRPLRPHRRYRHRVGNSVAGVRPTNGTAVGGPLWVRRASVKLVNEIVQAPS